MPRNNRIAASNVSQVAEMVQEGLAAGLKNDTALDENARLLRKKVYEKAGASFDALMELLESKKVALRTRMRVYETVVKLAFKDINDVAKLRLERERMALEAETARLDREAKERQAAMEPVGGPQIIVRLDSEAMERAQLAAGEQERLRLGRPAQAPNGTA